MRAIPKGTDKESVYVRRAIIISQLSVLIGQSVKCPALGKNVEVEFVFDSIDETATRAAQRYESTLAALKVKEAIRKSTFVKNDVPKSNKQRKMRFVKMIELESTLSNIGTVKIMVGERKTKRVLHYCITKKEK